MIEPNTVSEEIACTIDLLPTFAELAQCELPARVIDGKSIKDLMVSDSATTPHEAIYYYDRDQLQAVRSGKWKLFLPLQDYSRHPHFKQKPHGGPLLFDLMKDIACQKDVAAENPEVVRRLKLTLKRREPNSVIVDTPGKECDNVARFKIRPHRFFQARVNATAEDRNGR